MRAFAILCLVLLAGSALTTESCSNLCQLVQSESELKSSCVTFCENVISNVQKSGLIALAESLGVSLKDILAIIAPYVQTNSNSTEMTIDELAKQIFDQVFSKNVQRKAAKLGNAPQTQTEKILEVDTQEQTDDQGIYTKGDPLKTLKAIYKKGDPLKTLSATPTTIPIKPTRKQTLF